MLTLPALRACPGRTRKRRATARLLVWHSRVMKADRVEISRDEQKKKWLVRIKVGEEVIRRYCDEPKDVDETSLRRSAIQTVTDEGYTVDPSDVVIS